MGADKPPSNRLSIMAQKKKNTGIPYEKLVQGIFQAIHNQEEVATITVEQNKTVQGKISTHQIDVYWKFQTGGIEHEVIVQAKDWRSAVKQGDLFHFKSVLDDLPNQPRGFSSRGLDTSKALRTLQRRRELSCTSWTSPHRKRT
jgi:hypothetical protein